MNEAKSVTATFAVESSPSLDLTAFKTGAGSGTVASSPAGIDCGGTCTAEFEEGSEVKLSAEANPGSEFREWTGACSGSEAICEVTMTEAKAVSARFSHERPTLTLTKTGGGTVKSKPKGISCGANCPQTLAQYYKGTTVVLMAKAPTGVKFTGWEGCKVLTQTELESTCEVKVEADQEVSAGFTPAVKPLVNAQTLSLSKAPATAGPQGYGTVKGTWITCEAACTSTEVGYFGGQTEPKPKAATTVTLVAAPSPGSEFVGWTGCDSEPEGKCVVSMSKAQAVAAQFTAKPVMSLVLDKTGGGSVGAKPKGIACGATCSQAIAWLPEGTAVVLLAKAPTGVKFTEWEGCKVLTQTELESTCEVMLSSSKVVKAMFTPAVKALVNPQALTLSKAGTGTGTVKGTWITCEAACTSTEVEYFGGQTEPKPKAATTVTLVAAPSPGSEFVGWTGCDSEPEGKCVVSMSKAQAVAARFEE